MWHDEVGYVNGRLTACGISQCCEASSQRERFERLAQDFTTDPIDDNVCAVPVRGKLIVVGVPNDPMQLNAFPLVCGGCIVYGSLTGTPIESEDALAFSVLENIRPVIETFPLEQATDAYARMMEGKARFRMVLVTSAGVAQKSATK